MKTRRRSTLLATALVVILYGGCDRETKVNPANVNPTPGVIAGLTGGPKKTAPARLVGGAPEEVTFYPTYGYREGAGWAMHLRGWVHDDRKHVTNMIGKVAEADALFRHVLQLKQKCEAAEMDTFVARADDFVDDDKSLEKVVIKFDNDPEDKPYEFRRRLGLNGIVELDLTLTAERAAQLLERQGSTNGWLTFRAVSGDHAGIGRVKLIEPEGVSLISDIDDTIKITEVPAGMDVVLRNTFCRGFKADDGMRKKYEELGDIPVHYVSGGPEQLFGPLYDFLIKGDGDFPEGTFHLKFFPKNLLTREARGNLKNFAASSLDVTFDHKLEQITRLMDKYPRRQFILSGDSGEIDPEVYRHIRASRGAQVKAIWIRDVINEKEARPSSHDFRLEGMDVIKVDKPTCVDDKHFKKLSDMLKSEKIRKVYGGEQEYGRNAAPCGG